MRRNQKQPSDDLTKIYREFPRIDIGLQSRSLQTFLTHNAAFCELGLDHLARATLEAWFGDAILLAIAPTDSADEALHKVESLSVVDAVVATIGGAGHRSASVIIATAIEAERQRWQLKPARQH